MKLQRFNFIDALRRQIACCEADVITWDSLWCKGHQVAELEAQHAELLDALKRIYEISANCPCEVTDEELNAYSQARAAIAKAEGEGV